MDLSLAYTFCPDLNKPDTFIFTLKFRMLRSEALLSADKALSYKPCEKIHHGRDINAAVNIKNFTLRNYVSGTDTKTRNELPTLLGVLTSEAQPIASGVGG